MQEKTTYPVGTVLWRMIGRRQNSEIRWYAAPLCIEYVDKHKFLNADNIGGGWNSIGKNYFLTREECLENFKAKGNSLLEKILINAPTPEGIVEKPRTEWDDYEFHLFGAEGNHDASDTSVTVYAGFYDGLKNISDRLLWRSKLTDGYGKVNSLTLREIYERDEAKAEAIKKWNRRAYNGDDKFDIENLEKPKEAIIMNQNTFWVMLFALRYASPRNTAALRIVSGYIIEHLDMMTTNQKEMLKQEIIGLSPVEKRYAKRYFKELCDRLEIR